MRSAPLRQRAARRQTDRPKRLRPPPRPGPRPCDPRRPRPFLAISVTAALQSHRGSVVAAARSLGISKVSLYDLLRRHQIQTTAAIPSDEFLRAYQELAGDLAAMSARFGGVSIRSIQLRLRHLGVKRDDQDPSDD